MNQPLNTKSNKPMIFSLVFAACFNDERAYPFGMGLIGRQKSPANYRYGFNSQEKETEITDTDSHYSAEYWMYDSRLGRRWNIDPVKKQHESSYATFANNPIFLVDPLGADTININNQGVISGITPAAGNHLLFDHRGSQIQFNDPEYDTQLINDRGIKVGDKLVTYLSTKETTDLVDGQSKVNSKKAAYYLNLFNPAAGLAAHITSLFGIAKKSYNEWDFSHSVLGTMVNANLNHNLGNTIVSEGRTYIDDYTYEQYYFFVFGNAKKAYNLGDAGNFMWGMAGQRSGFTWIELKAGSNLNELRQGRGFDSDADQRAIEDGFDFKRK